MNPILSEEVRVVLDIGGEICFRNMKEKIYWASHKDKMEEYLEEKYKWGQVIKKIYWIKSNRSTRSCHCASGA